MTALPFHQLKRGILMLLSFTLLTTSIANAKDQPNARMLVNLMDYIAKDYVMAVKDGEVISEFEYAEMYEFVNTAGDAATRIDGDSNLRSTLVSEIAVLGQLINDRSDSDEVAAKARSIKEHLLATGIINTAPAQWPDLAAGKALYTANCASCHGTYGDGDGKAGTGLNPPPTNFRDGDIMKEIAPFQAFNTIKLGIPGTGMRSFVELSDSEIWNLAFYIKSLNHLDERSAKPQQAVSLQDLSSLNDVELTTKHPNIHLAAHRSSPMPVKGAVAANSNTELARTKLESALKYYQSGNTEEALHEALSAYLEGIEPIEAQVKASDNQLFELLESDMMAVRANIQGELSIKEVENSVSKAMMTIDEAETLLGNSDRGMMTTALIALSILLREGLEAFFVILAILGILKSVGAPKAARWIHGGWITAVLFGLVGWFFADALLSLSAQGRELMEGLIALFAVVVLLYIGFWLHGKTEASRWKEFIEVRIKKLINQNNMIGLAAFSFVVVFREAFESVLFLSSLTATGEEGAKLGVLLGFIGAALLLLAIAWAILKWFKKLPIRKVFLYSSMVILVLAFILAGEGIHAIQEGGFLAISSLPINIRIAPLGVYPTYETALTQAAVLICILVLWKYQNRKAVAA